jgi:hypothetical protein
VRSKTSATETIGLVEPEQISQLVRKRRSTGDVTLRKVLCVWIVDECARRRAWRLWPASTCIAETHPVTFTWRTGGAIFVILTGSPQYCAALPAQAPGWCSALPRPKLAMAATRCAG